MLNRIRSGEVKIAVIGLGYVGLPLAAEFGKKFDTVGFDRKSSRIEALRRGEDATGETPVEKLRAAVKLRLSGDPADLRDRDVFIVAVPTPVDKYNRPDLSPLCGASATVGKAMKKGAIVVYESTVYPGCTEEECVPVLERESGMKFNDDFFCGYSPERLNPGDREHSLTKIRKITSGSTPEVAKRIDDLYNSILENGTFMAPSIKVAEAAKAVENSQRDVNISFMNELALICDRVGIDTLDVLEAAATKWNFLPYRPGLVGGHCISVDPYYLAHKAKMVGYDPQVILSGRAVNNSMAKFIADKTLKLLIQKGFAILNTKVLILGVTFKENCPDIRNTKVVDIARELEEFGCRVDIYDPWANPEEVQRELGQSLIPEIDPATPYRAIIACVAHKEFQGFDFARYKQQGCVIFDVKGTIKRELADARL